MSQYTNLNLERNQSYLFTLDIDGGFASGTEPEQDSTK